MTKTQNNIKQIIPVLFAFFVMSFADLVGVATDYVKADFKLSDTLVQLISFATFLWFFVFSVPAGILQNKIGKRNMLNIGIGLSALGMLFPFVSYSFASVLIGFSLLGIGNTVIQVSANPLLVSIVNPDRASSILSFSQFVKAVGSMVAAPLTAFFMLQTGNWRFVFLSFAAISVLSALWLQSVKFEDSKSEQGSVSMASCFKLLGNSYILTMVLAIFLVVGIDVGVNSSSGQFFMEKYGLSNEVAASGRSVYFFGKLIGCLLGAAILRYMSAHRLLMLSSIASVAFILALTFNPYQIAAWTIIFFIGFSIANIFPLVFSITVGRHSSNSDEISGLMMMAIVGGAIIPPVMGFFAGLYDYSASMLFLVACAAVILYIGWRNK